MPCGQSGGAGTGCAQHSPCHSPTRPPCSPPTSTLYIASTTISVQLRIGTETDTVCMEKQDKPITSHTKLTGKVVTMPQSGSPWFPMKWELCILSEYSQAAVGSQTVNRDVRSPPGVQANCSLNSLRLEEKQRQISEKFSDNKSKYTPAMKIAKAPRPCPGH